MQLTMVVLPVPGPPVMMASFSLRARATAWACSSERVEAPLLLDPADEILQVQGRGLGRGQLEAAQVPGDAGFRHPGDLPEHPPPISEVLKNHPALPGQGLQGLRQGPRGHLQQFPGFLEQHVLGDVDVTFPGLGLQHVEEPRGQAGRGQGVEVEAGRQVVGGDKAQPLDVQGQLVGVGCGHGHGLVAVLLVDLGGKSQAQAQPLEGHQELPGPFVLLPVLSDLLYALLARCPALP